MVLLVAALHLVALWLLTQGAPPARDRPRAAVALRIVPAAPRTRIEPPLPAPPTPPAARQAAAAVRRTNERLSTKPPLQPAPAEEPAPPSPVAITVAPAASAASAAQPALRLDLPHRGLTTTAPRNPALDDPRANTAPAGMGERLAATLGSDPRRSEESRGEGRLRVREGASCVDVRVSRNTQIDPMEQSYRPTPKLVETCR